MISVPTWLAIAAVVLMVAMFVGLAFALYIGWGLDGLLSQTQAELERERAKIVQVDLVMKPTRKRQLRDAFEADRELGSFPFEKRDC